MGDSLARRFSNYTNNQHWAYRYLPVTSAVMGMGQVSGYLADAVEGSSFDEILGNQTEEAGALVDLSASDDGPQRNDTALANRPPTLDERGVPLNLEEQQDLSHQYWLRGRARVRSFVEMFGVDALVLGHLLFKIPPLAIRIKKGNLTYRWKPLRTQESIAVKSGNGDCYIEIDLAFVGLDQISTTLAELIALWKSVPFCFIENLHIRKMMIPDNPDESMAVCLESLIMDSISGSPNTVYATLLLKWFNYKPFSQNFWFRREWKPAIPQDAVNSPEVAGFPYENPNEIPEIDTPTNPLDINRNILVDLSQIENPELFPMLSYEHPAEVGLSESLQITNPGDATIAGTYPVVYPFNSQPFLDRVASVMSPTPIRRWRDSLSMNFNTFIRAQMPTRWQYSLNDQSRVTTSVTARPRPASSPRTGGGPTSTGGNPNTPAPVVGDRDIILFMGDSIMTGFTGNATRLDAQIRTNPPNPDQAAIPFFDWQGGDPESNSSYFPRTEGFTYKGIFRVGTNSATLLRWWNAKKNDPSLKAENNDQPCSRVAGVLIHCSGNDGYTGPDMESLTPLMTEISEYGAIPMLLPMPPLADADFLSPPMLSQGRTFFGGVSNYRAYIQGIPDYHARMLQSVQDISNAMFIDYHELMVEARFHNNRAAALKEEYMLKNSPDPGVYNIHWNSQGYREGGRWIRDSMPWNSLSGQETEVTPAEQWTVCEVQDGDSVKVFGTSPDTGERVVRDIRMKYTDSPETYYKYENTVFNEFDARALPNGQDSYRPANKRFGEIAKNALRSRLQVNDPVTVIWHGTDVYGRYLGEIFKDGENINLWMVEYGYSFADIPSRPDASTNEPEIALAYSTAEQIAQGRWEERGRPPNGPRGIWLQTTSGLSGYPDSLLAEDLANLGQLLPPAEWRRIYPPASGGGFDEPTEGPCVRSEYTRDTAPNPDTE